MSVLDVLNHLLNFALPAFFLALVLGLASRFIVQGKASARPLWRQIGINFAAGLLVLVAGLILFGRDGKMATYAALVVVSSTVQWWLSGGFRR